MLELPKQDQEFADELCYTVQTNKTLHSSCWQSREGHQILLAQLSCQQQKPWKSAILTNMIFVPKGEWKGLLCHPSILLSHSQALGSLIIGIQNYFSLCSFADTHHEAQIPPHRQGFPSRPLLDCKKLQALNKAFPFLRGLNRYLSWVVPQLPREMRNYAKALF